MRRDRKICAKSCAAQANNRAVLKVVGGSAADRPRSGEPKRIREGQRCCRYRQISLRTRVRCAQEPGIDKEVDAESIFIVDYTRHLRRENTAVLRDRSRAGGLSIGRKLVCKCRA